MSLRNFQNEEEAMKAANEVITKIFSDKSYTNP